MKNKVIVLISIIIISTLSSFSKNQEMIVNDLNIIYLIGEIHYDPGCKKIKDRLLIGARDGQHSVALEGAHSDMETIPNVFGIEDKNTHMLTDALNFYLVLVLYKTSKDLLSLNNEQFPEIIKIAKRKLDAEVPSLDSLFQMLYMLDLALMCDQSIDSRNSKIVNNLRKLNEFRLSYPFNYNKKVEKMIEDHSFEKPFFLRLNKDIFQWINLYRNIIDALITKVTEENEFFSKTIIDEIKTYVTRLENYANMGAEQLTSSILVDFSIDMNEFAGNIIDVKRNVRDETFLKHIINIFENKAIGGKPLYAIIGVNHVPFLYEKLTQKGYEVKRNNMTELYSKYPHDFSTKIEL